MAAMYYADKTQSLREIFGAAALQVEADRIVVDGRTLPVVDDVIVCLDASQWLPRLGAQLGGKRSVESGPADFAEDIQYTFGAEWRTFSSIVPDHETAFEQYFDLIDLSQLGRARVCDLGCGMGRWSYFVSRWCREIVLVDFSEAIFVARRNLRERANAIFIMADIRRLPFAPDFADLLFCLGVLHHLPTPVLDEVVALRRYARRLLIYVYYALDNRPPHFRALLALVTGIRTRLAHLRNERLRHGLAILIALFVYRPLVGFGHSMRPFGLQHRIPLYESYRGKSLHAVTQDAYDRFFTRIEQRVSRKDIRTLEAAFSRVSISDRLPYWHFVCER
jgi:SAM-dependent methyltransferase